MECIVETPEQNRTQLFYEALAAYVSSKNVSEIALPLRTDSYVGKKHILLRTGRYTLAKYDLNKKALVKI